VFGNSSTVFSSLMKTFAPIVQAGPDQQGFSPTLNANLNSQAITQTAQGYKNAKAAVGNEEAAIGGGNTSLPNGATIGADVNLASSAANQTSSELSQITQANYAQGNKNYTSAVGGEEALPGVFTPASGAAGEATGAGEAAGSMANQISSENSSWVGAVTGALGSAAGAAAKM
jgi:hypothetical protein